MIGRDAASRPTFPVSATPPSTFGAKRESGAMVGVRLAGWNVSWQSLRGGPTIRVRRRASGFTLVEMLVVLGIIILLTSLVVPAIATILRGSQLSQGTDILSNQLDFARQTALSRNHVIEARFYQYADPTYPGETQGNPNSGKYRAFQLFDVTDTGTTTPLGKVQKLPLAIIVDSGSKLSPLIGTQAANAVAPAKSTGAAMNVSIPGVGYQYNVVSFRFLPDGSTNLPGTAAAGRALWYVTLHNVLDGDALGTPPTNFSTIELDAADGQIRTFRP